MPVAGDSDTTAPAQGGPGCRGRAALTRTRPGSIPPAGSRSPGLGSSGPGGAPSMGLSGGSGAGRAHRPGPLAERCCGDRGDAKDTAVPRERDGKGGWVWVWGGASSASQPLPAAPQWEGDERPRPGMAGAGIWQWALPLLQLIPPGYPDTEGWKYVTIAPRMKG